MASNPDGELQTCISEQPAISSFISATSEFASRTAYVDNPSRGGVLTDLSRLTIKYPAAITDFFGTPGSAPCVYKSGPAWPGFPGLEKRHIIREIRPVYGHPIADSWLKIGTGICDVLDSRGVSWTSIDPVAFANAGEAKPFCPLLMWIGVKQSLVFDDAVIAANSIKDLLGSAGFPEIEVAFRESEVTYSASGPKLSPFDPVRDRVAEFRKPFAPVLGLPIAPLKKPTLRAPAPSTSVSARMTSASPSSLLPMSLTRLLPSPIMAWCTCGQASDVRRLLPSAPRHIVTLQTL